MKRSFALSLFKEGREAACYTLHFTKEQNSEPQKFINHLSESEPESFEEVNWRLENMLEEHQFLPPMLELEEGKRDDWVVAIKTKEPKHLRWYGLRYNHKILILGNGGLKSTETYQDDPHLHKCVKDLQWVFKCIKRRMRRREIHFDGVYNRITGKLHFNKSHFSDISYPNE